MSVGTFDAKWRGRAVQVSWKTAAGAKVAGFNVYRKAGHGPFRKLNRRLIPAGSATAGGAYRFVDRSAQRSQFYVYRLQVVDTAGTRAWYGLSATP